MVGGLLGQWHERGTPASASGPHIGAPNKCGTGLLCLLTLGLSGLAWTCDYWTLNAQISDRNHTQRVA